MTESKDAAVPPSEGTDENSALLDAREPLVPREEGTGGTPDPEKGEGGGAKAGEAPRSMVFNWGDRPDHDVIFGRIFLACMALLVLREAIVFAGPVLSLKFFDASTFTLEPFVSILLGLAITVPGCFILLWSCKNIRPQVVQVCLILCCAFFLVSLVASLAFHRTPAVGTEERDDYPTLPGGQQQSSDLRTQPSHRPVGALGDESEASMLEAAIPGSISRILLASSSLAAREAGPALALPSASHSLPHSTVATVARRMLLSAGGAARRVLLPTSLLQRDRLALAETVVTNLVNALGVFLILYHCDSLFPLTSLVISDSAKFVLTRGRGLVFKVVAAVALAVLSSLPVISSGLQVYKACDQAPIGPHDVVTNSQRQLCLTWKAAVFVDPFSGGILLVLGLFFAAWSLLQFQVVLQFMAAHVVGQCYSNTGTSMDEDDLTSIVRAAKCALGPSFGSLSLLSLVSVGALGSSIFLNLLVMGLFGGSVLAAVPLVFNSCVFFAISLFLSCFVLPFMAVSGQSFADSARSSLSLVQRNLVPAVAFTLSSLSVVGVLILLILFAASIAGVAGAFLVSVFGSISGFRYMAWLLVLVALVVSTSLGALTLFHWVFSTTISTLFLCLAMEGKANETTSTTPLGLDD